MQKMGRKKINFVAQAADPTKNFGVVLSKVMARAADSRRNFAALMAFVPVVFATMSLIEVVLRMASTRIVVLIVVVRPLFAPLALFLSLLLFVFDASIVPRFF